MFAEAFGSWVGRRESRASFDDAGFSPCVCSTNGEYLTAVTHVFGTDRPQRFGCLQ